MVVSIVHKKQWWYPISDPWITQPPSNLIPSHCPWLLIFCKSDLTKNIILVFCKKKGRNIIILCKKAQAFFFRLTSQLWFCLTDSHGINKIKSDVTGSPWSFHESRQKVTFKVVIQHPISVAGYCLNTEFGWDIQTFSIYPWHYLSIKWNVAEDSDIPYI